MSHAKGVGGWQTLLTNFVDKTLSSITSLTRCPKDSFWTVRALALTYESVYARTLHLSSGPACFYPIMFEIEVS